MHIHPPPPPLYNLHHSIFSLIRIGFKPVAATLEPWNPGTLRPPRAEPHKTPAIFSNAPVRELASRNLEAPAPGSMQAGDDDGAAWTAANFEGSAPRVKTPSKGRLIPGRCSADVKQVRTGGRGALKAPHRQALTSKCAPVVKRGKGAPARQSPGQVPRQKGPLTKPCNGERVRAIGGKAPHEADHDEVSLAHPRTDLKPSNAVDTYCWTPVEDTRCGHLLLDTRCGHLLFDTR
jgi:hypothetical protein